MELQQLPFDIRSLHQAYDDGARPEQVLSEVYRRIAARDDPGIFLHLLPIDDALAAARALPAVRGTATPLWGIPFVIKDNIDAGGTPTTAACPAFSYMAEQDAFVVNALREAGALLIGKTNLDQFATGLVGIRTPYPAPLNAVDPAIVPGGSSSGSAVAVAHGLVSFSLGTDTAGSGRVPAALNNIVGLKPTLGALSATGVVPACRTLDTVSVFALCVDDAYTVFQAAARYDADDAFARRGRYAHPYAPAGLRVAVPTAASREFHGDSVQSEAFDSAIGMLRSVGTDLTEIDFAPFLAVAQMLYSGAWVAERMSVVQELLRTDPNALHPVTRRVIEAADGMTAVDVFRDVYRLKDFQRTIERAIEDVDVLCVPSIPTFYSVAEVEADPVGTNSRLGTYTNFVNLLDMCAISVPVGRRSDGRPSSLTLIARAGQDGCIAALAARLHGGAGVSPGATDWLVPRADMGFEGASEQEVAIAVVGAHMSGLPLNKELSSRGGRFLRAARTAPVYRLYSLPGGPPARPGLVRGESGSAIALEIWALPRSALGDFMLGIPAPLAIGTVELEEGGSVKGFLCESAGLAGAEDISRFGGWRAFLADKT